MSYEVLNVPSNTCSLPTLTRYKQLKQAQPTKKSRKEVIRAERLSLLPSESFAQEEDSDMDWELSENTLHQFMTEVATARRKYRGEPGAGLAHGMSPSQCWTASD